MPFNQEFLQINQVGIHLFHFKEFDPFDYLDQLTTEEQERFFLFKHINRQREFVATRILRHRLFGFEHIHYDENGAPFINKEGYISISHAPNMVGIAMCKEFKVGLDLETIRAKSLLVKHKFLSHDESNKLDLNSKVEMTKVWSGKEALYKLAGRKEIHFKTELLLQKKTETNWIGIIHNHDHSLKVEMCIFEHNGTIVSLNKMPCERI
jgi:4'-phosphopantetheinyl transferase EntD